VGPVVFQAADRASQPVDSRAAFLSPSVPSRSGGARLPSRSGEARLDASIPRDPPSGGSNGDGGGGGGSGDNDPLAVFKPFWKKNSTGAPKRGKDNEPNEVRIVRSTEDPKEFTVYCDLIMSYPVDKVMDLLTDYDNLPEYIPDRKKSYRLAPTQNGVTKVFQQGEEKVLGIKFKVGMNLRMEQTTEGSNKVLKFVLLESPVMQKTYGQTTLTPIDHGKKTHFKYEITIRPKGYLPVGAPLERRMKEAIPERLIATAKGVELRSHDAATDPADATSRGIFGWSRQTA
jgi:hypothetical protein